jgi:hypothetical protein
MTARISLAEWIASIRAEVAEAVAWQKERTALALKQGQDPIVPPLLLQELKLEVEVETKGTRTAKGGVEFWVVSADVEHGHSEAAKHRVVLTLRPQLDVPLGNERGFLEDQ